MTPPAQAAGGADREREAEREQRSRLGIDGVVPARGGEGEPGRRG
jgi:hypothetical protein